MQPSGITKPAEVASVGLLIGKNEDARTRKYKNFTTNFHIITFTM
jgi:hypothetical protein